MKIKNKIKLRFKDDKRNKDPEIKRWLTQVENSLNNELKNNHVEFISLDSVDPLGTKIVFTTRHRNVLLFYPQIVKTPKIYYPDLIVSVE